MDNKLQQSAIIERLLFAKHDNFFLMLPINRQGVSIIPLFVERFREGK